MTDVLIAIDSFPPDFTGAGLRALRMCERISKKSKVSFKVLCRNKRNIRETTGNLEVQRMKTIKEQGISFPFYLFQTLWKTNQYLIKNRKQIDIIHFFSFSWMNRLIMLSNTLFYKKKTILEVTLEGYDDPTSLISTGKRNKLMKYLTKFLLKRIDLFIAPSKKSVESCLAQGIKENKVVIMPRPVDEKTFASIPFSRKNKLRKKLGLPNKFILLNIGMMYPRKNQLFLIKCLELLHDQNIILVLIGPTDKGEENREYYAKLKKYVSDKSLKNNVIFLNEKKNINEYLLASDLFVFSSLAEGFPNVIVEAIMSGLPFVTLQLDVIEDFLSSEIGVMINNIDKTEVKSQQEFAHVIKRIYNKKIVLNRNQIRKYGIKLFSAEKIDNMYLEFYSNLVQK